MISAGVAFYFFIFSIIVIILKAPATFPLMSLFRERESGTQFRMIILKLEIK